MRMYLLDKKQRVRRWLKDNDFIEAEMTEEINAANQINFSMPLKDRIADNIYYVAIPTPHSKQKYLLFKLLSERVQNDRIEYQGIEEAYDELKQYGYIKDIRPNDRTAEEMLKMVLEPTRWTLGNVPETNHQSTNFYYITYLEALQKIVGLFNIELTFEVTIDPKSNKITRRQVNVYNQQGQRTGKRFEYGSNLLTIEQEQDSQELITALVGRGKGEQVSEGHDDTPDGYGRRITFADVVWTKKDGNPVDKPAGQEYLVDPEATELYGFSDGKPRIGLTVFEDIEDPIELINATWKALQSLKRPKVNFKASVTDVGKLGLGDTVAIIRHDLKIEYFTRVYKVKHDLLNENNNQIELGDDFSSHSITNSIIKVDGIANEAKESANHAAIAANGKNNNYYSSVQPLAPIEGDIWYKDLGNGETDMYQYHNGGWVFIQSTRDLHVVENQVKEAQDGLNKAKADIIANKQKADADVENLNKSIEDNKKVADQDIQNLNKSIEDNKKIADESLQKLNDSVTNLQGQYDHNVVPNLNKVMSDASDALQKYITAQNSIADLVKQAQQQGKDIADVTNTVKGLNINYANLAGDVNSTKVDVKGLQTIVGTANGDIAQLKLDAQNLQTMLAGKVDNTTYTNFVNLTNQALNARLTASDLNGYAKTADVQATANGLRVDLNSVTDRINNLKVGTSNLLHHSDTFEGWHKGASVSVSSNKYLNGNIAVLKNTGSGGTALDAELDGPYDNQPISWAVYAKADNAGDKLHTELWGGGGFADQPLTTEWQVYKFTGQRDARDHSLYLWGCQGNKGNIYVALPFAVVGNTIGTWGPNASDIDHDLNELSARINVTNQQFSSYYTKSETDNRTKSAKNDAINAIKSDSNWQGLNNILTNSGFLQTADGFLQKVQQTTLPMFDGGGLNLLRMSGFHNVTLGQLTPTWTISGNVSIDTGTVKTGAIEIDARGQRGFREIQQQITVEPDTDYTFSMHLIGGKADSTFHAHAFMVEYDSDGKTTSPYVDHARDIVNAPQRSANTYTIHTSKNTHSVRLYIRAEAGSMIELEEIKLERGSVATPWTPNPADLATQSAFSELSQSLEGLRSTVGSNYGSLQSQISQSSSSIRTELTDKIKGIDNKTTSTADSLNSVIGRVGSLENLTNFQVINNAINANDYTNTGNYFIQSTANTNVPGTDWCYLKVERVNDGRIVQTWQADIDPTLRYVRTKFGDSWTQWQRSASYSEYSELNRTVQGLQSTVSNNHGELQSQISQTAKTIRQEVSDKTNGLQTQINQQANNFNVSLNSLRKETAWQKVTSAIDANNYKTTGNYWIQAAPNSNTPDSSAWAYLQVVAYPDVKRIKQTWQRDNNENEIYTRLLIGDNWTSWQRTVTGGNIMAQINMSAGATLIQNDKIYMDASSTIFSGNAFIPSAAITSLNADKITAGTINGAKVNVINLNANNITAGTLKGSNGEFYLDSGALHVWQNNHDAWIDQNGIHDYDNQGNNVWIKKGGVSAYGNTSSVDIRDGEIHLNKKMGLTDGVLASDYGSIKKADNVLGFGTSGLEFTGTDGFLLKTNGWENGILSRMVGSAINGSGIAGDKSGYMQLAASHKLFLYAGNPISVGKINTLPYLLLNGMVGNGRTELYGNFSSYRFTCPNGRLDRGLDLKDNSVMIRSFDGKAGFSATSNSAILTAGDNYISVGGIWPGVHGDFNVSGNFAVTGSKNAIVPTSRGMAAINAYETAEYYFGDIGETQTNSNGVVTVMIDPYFLETVNTLVPYQVFLTPYGDGNVWVSSRSANNFTVKSSNPNIHFAWEIKAKRKGYENDRMKIVKGVFNNEQ